MKDLRDHEGLSVQSVGLLSVGRQFRLSDRARLVVGRNHAENERLFDLEVPGARYVKVLGCKGPVGVLTGAPAPEDERLAASVVARYADTGDAESVRVELKGEEGAHEVVVRPMTTREVRRFAI